VYLREATSDDLHITHQWANHPHTRKFSFSQEFISLENHSKWFKAKLADGNSIYKILEIDNAPVGSIRLDIQDEVATISYLVSPEYTGKGFGKKILELMIVNIFNENPKIRLVRGLVKKENVASIKIFESFHFERNEMKEGILEFKKTIKHEDWK
jgi:RimJ/RimL family protein N-acetyltransferase